MAIKKKRKKERKRKASVHKDVGESVPQLLLVRYKVVLVPCESSLMVPQKSNIKVLYDPVFALLGRSYSREIKTGVQRKTCTHMFIAALLYLSQK